MLKIYKVETDFKLIRQYLMSLNKLKIYDIELEEVSLTKKHEIVYSTRYLELSFSELATIENFKDNKKNRILLIIKRIIDEIEDKNTKNKYLDRYKRLKSLFYKETFRIIKKDVKDNDRKKCIIINFLYKYQYQKFLPFKSSLPLFSYLSATINNYKNVSTLRKILNLNIILQTYTKNIKNNKDIVLEDIFFGDYLKDIKIEEVDLKIECVIYFIKNTISKVNSSGKNVLFLFESTKEMQKALEFEKSFHVETNFNDSCRFIELNSFILLRSILRKCDRKNYKKVLKIFLENKEEDNENKPYLFLSKHKKENHFIEFFKDSLKKNPHYDLTSINLFIFYLSMMTFSILVDNKSKITIDDFSHLNEIKETDEIVIIPTIYENKDKIDNALLFEILKENYVVLTKIKEKAKETVILLDKRVKYPLQIEGKLHSISSLFYLNLKV